MKDFVVYLANGRVIRSGSCQDDTFDLQTNEGEHLIEGDYSGNQYVADGQLVDMPPQPSDDLVFDYDTKQWVFDTAGSAAKAYAKRDQLLKDGPDRISPMWWSSMTPEEQANWTAYRQELLDITEQPGFPGVIIWPTRPA